MERDSEGGWREGGGKEEAREERGRGEGGGGRGEGGGGGGGEREEQENGNRPHRSLLNPPFGVSTESVK